MRAYSLVELDLLGDRQPALELLELREAGQPRPHRRRRIAELARSRADDAHLAAHDAPQLRQRAEPCAGDDPPDRASAGAARRRSRTSARTIRRPPSPIRSSRRSTRPVARRQRERDDGEQRRGDDQAAQRRHAIDRVLDESRPGARAGRLIGSAGSVRRWDPTRCLLGAWALAPDLGHPGVKPTRAHTRCPHRETRDGSLRDFSGDRRVHMLARCTPWPGSWAQCWRARCSRRRPPQRRSRPRRSASATTRASCAWRSSSPAASSSSTRSWPPTRTRSPTALCACR